MKKAIIVNCSDVVEYRVDMVYECMKKYGWKVEVITSDYMHIEKKKRIVHKKNYVTVKTIPYKKNISFRRLYSHYDLAKKVYNLLKNKQYDLLYIIVPPNSMASIAKKVKKNTNAKVVMDIIDLWPESFPVKGTDKFPFSIWGNIRNKYIKYADYIITECDLYQKELKNVLKDKMVKTIYWSHKDNDCQYYLSNTLAEHLTLCYLGSVNNIIDIDEIQRVVGEQTKTQQVTVKLIAAGEKKDELICKLKEIGAEVIDYGKIYDYKKKKEIIDTCHYGINIMKNTVKVGISMKSIDYLEMGLPIINNLNADLGEIIKVQECGINIFDKDDLKIDIKNYNYEEIRNKTRGVYNLYFTRTNFQSSLMSVINEIYTE